MATQGSVVAIDIAAFSAQLLDNREGSPRARIIVQAITDLMPGTAANVYLLARLDEGQVGAPQATSGWVAVHHSSIAAVHGSVRIIDSTPMPLVPAADQLV